MKEQLDIALKNNEEFETTVSDLKETLKTKNEENDQMEVKI